MDEPPFALRAALPPREVPEGGPGPRVEDASVDHRARMGRAGQEGPPGRGGRKCPAGDRGANVIVNGAEEPFVTFITPPLHARNLGMG